MNTLKFRSVKTEEYDWLHDLNEACVPAMNYLGRDAIPALVARSYLTRVVLDEAQPVGVIIGFAQNADYASENFCWFRERFDDFLYIDRLMIEGRLRGKGFGTALYTDMFDVAKREGFTSVVCEVNEHPPNPKSMKFHRDRGFAPVESRFNEAHGKQVAMLRKILNS